jgi:hypothetical protein
MGSQPKAPDPMMSMLMQQQANSNAANQQQKTNMISQSTPYGSLDYSSDPNAPGGYRATQTLTPGLQNVFDQSVNNSLDAVKGASTLFGNNKASMTGMSPQFNPLAMNLENASSMSPLQNNNNTLSLNHVDPTLNQGSYKTDLNLQNANGNLGLQNNNPNLDLGFDANARRLSDLNKSTLDPYWKQQQNDFDQTMQNRGVVPGSVQYDNAYRNFNTAKSNAYNQADMNAYNTVAGNAATQFNANNSVVNQNNQNAQNQFNANMTALNANNQNAQNQFNAYNTGTGLNNQNAQNQFDANLSATGQNNQADTTAYTTNANTLNQNNQNTVTGYNADLSRINTNNQNALNYQNNNIQNLGASLQAYNAPFNTYAALNSGGQVNQPVQSIGLTQTPQASVQAPDYMGMASSNYGQQSANNNAFNSGLFGLGGSILGGFGTGIGARLGAGRT